VQTEEYEILLKTKAAVEQFSQVRLSYSEKMETLEVLAGYTLTADGQRRDVQADRIYTQESYSSAAAAMYADRKVRVVVFPNLAPGTRVVYQTRRTQNTPYFPGYFGLWETFSVFTPYDDARVTLTAPANLPMQVEQRGVQGSTTPRIRNGLARWEWQYRRSEPLSAQNWSAAPWEYSPGIMASTYRDWAQVAQAYQRKGGEAATVPPQIQALADDLTRGITDRREQAAVLYRWVSQNIRYVAVYLGNGGLEPNPAQSILDNHYGDCKDHVVILEALLAARGIESTPVLIGAGGGPTLPTIPLLGRFNHAITYLPEFDLYLDSTTAYARFGQLPDGDLGAPVLHTRQAKVARTPANDATRNGTGLEVDFRFDAAGNLVGQTVQQPSSVAEIGMRAAFARLNAQNRARAEESMMAASGFDGSGALTLLGDPQDLTRPFNFRYDSGPATTSISAWVAACCCPTHRAASPSVTCTPAPRRRTTPRRSTATTACAMSATSSRSRPTCRSSRSRAASASTMPPASTGWTGRAKGRWSPCSTACTSAPCAGRMRCASRRITPPSARCTSRSGAASAGRWSMAT